MTMNTHLGPYKMACSMPLARQSMRHSSAKALATTILEGVAGACTSLREISFPQTLHTIRVKAFMNCAALLELAIPPSLKYAGS